MNPILIKAIFNVKITITNTHFSQNIYSIIEKSHDRFLLSSTGIGADFLSGIISLTDCTFKDSSSNAAFNYIRITEDNINMDNVTFDRSSYDDKIDNQAFLLKQYGGNLHLKVKSIYFINCKFSKSTAYLGSFIYAEPNSSILEIYIQDAYFSEGYVSNNGGAIYLYPSNTI